MDKTTAIPPSATSSRPKSAFQQVTLNLTLDEAEILKQYCEQTGKSEQDLIRTLILELPVT